MTKAIAVFEKLRNHVTLEKVVAGENNDEFMKMFWEEYSSATRLGECYCFLPWIHGKWTPRFHNNTQKKESGQRRQREQNKPNNPRSYENTKKVFNDEEDEDE